MKQLLYIDGKLPGLNEITNASRANRYASAEQKKRYTNKVAWACIEQYLQPVNKKIDVKFIWFCKDRRRDKDNIMAGQKFIFDGLQEAKIIKNDGWKEIGNIEHNFKLCDINAVEVLLSEVDE